MVEISLISVASLFSYLKVTKGYVLAGEQCVILWRCVNDQDAILKLRLALSCAASLRDRLPVRDDRNCPEMSFSVAIAISLGRVTSMFLGGVDDRWEVGAMT